MRRSLVHRATLAILLVTWIASMVGCADSVLAQALPAEQMVGPAWVPTGSLITARSFHTATLLRDGKVLVVGGQGIDGLDMLASAELYDPELGMWSITGSLTTPRTGHTATLLANGQVLVVGGDYSLPALVIQGTAELYDPATGAWIQTGRLNTPRIGFSATLLRDGKVLIAGGVGNAFRELRSAEIYDPETGTWSATNSLDEARDSHTATLLQDGKVLVAKGTNGDLDSGMLSSAELYDPFSGEWSNVGGPGWGSIYHTETLMTDGSVLVTGGDAGGIGFDLVLAVSQRFDPVARTWTRTGDLMDRRFGHTATLLAGGSVLISGGTDETGADPHLQYATLASTEQFDPTTGMWTRGASLNAARTYHTATLLGDGRILVVGGSATGPANTRVPLNSAEVYLAPACEKNHYILDRKCPDSLPRSTP